MRPTPILAAPILAAATLAAVLLAGCGTMQIGEANFLKPDKPGAAPRQRLDVAAMFPAATVRDETVAAADGAQLRGLTVRQPGASAAVLYFGGNMFHLDAHGAGVLPLLAACGSNVVVFDYRGYGRSGGTPTLARLLADALRVFDHVNAQHPGAVVVHGQSLGSFVAGHVARERASVRALVLEATATNVPDWVDANVPWYARPFVKLEVGEPLRAVDNAAVAARYRGPALVLAGTRDKATPPVLGRKVFDALPGPHKQWLQVDATHNGIFGHPQVAKPYCDLVSQAR
ncbi:alpha/beta hydrolase [Massilia glaciei]|nr:alpha/beta fold hydrolase [Massilia glaciei]